MLVILMIMIMMIINLIKIMILMIIMMMAMQISPLVALCVPPVHEQEVPEPEKYFVINLQRSQCGHDHDEYHDIMIGYSTT